MLSTDPLFHIFQSCFYFVIVYSSLKNCWGVGGMPPSVFDILGANEVKLLDANVYF